MSPSLLLRADTDSGRLHETTGLYRPGRIAGRMMESPGGRLAPRTRPIGDNGPGMEPALQLPTRREVIAEAQSRGRRVAAVLPYHYPRVLLRAYGFHPVELWGPPGIARDQGSRHFPAYTCDIVVRATSFLLQGGLDEVDAILVPHTCDALQGMGSVLGDFLRPRAAVLTLYLPRGRRPTDGDFLAAELRRLGASLAALTGAEPDAAAWEEAVAAEGAADAALAALYRRRPRLAVSDRDFYTVVRAREYLPAEEFTALAAGLPEGDPPQGVPLLLSGIVAEPPDLFDHLAAVGARVVADDLACGARRLYPEFADGDPFERLARRLLGGPPDPTRGSPIAERAAHLRERMEESGARGLVVYDVKFCEPELFDVPLLRSHLGEAGFPLLHVEVELGEGLGQQTLTRLEAFVETLR
jgi:benzoyl-CoA reductase/2-hydroxyglutaryl-CoA dehydratase subunit BcrC/BadD/HgdB